MGKRSEANIGGDTRILYKKSNNTIFTHSRTCSGTSQLFTRSGILQIKKNLSRTNPYYIDGDKIKRDLSIETDVCLLRRYYRSKRSKVSNQEGASTKSKYSTVFVTEINTIKELQPDDSACGDTDRTQVNNRTDLDLTSIMMENFKSLINKWIQKHLLDNKDMKQKIDTVLDSLLHKLESNQPSVNSPSSCSTYILNKDDQSQVKKKRIVASITCQYSKHKSPSTGVETPSYAVSKNSSYHSMLFPYKNLRIISTLSIPRNSHKHKSGKKNKDSLYKIKKIKHNDVLCSVNRPSKMFMDTSNYDLLAISTKSLTKRCATYDMYTKKKKHIRNRQTVLVPQPGYKTITDTTVTNDNENIKNLNNKTHIDAVPSLVKRMFAGDPANITSTDKNNCYVPRNDNCTMTDMNNMSQETATSITLVQGTRKKSHEIDSKYVQNKFHSQSKPTPTIDFCKQSPGFSNILKLKHSLTSTVCKGKNNRIVKKVKVYKQRKICPQIKIMSPLKYPNIKCKKFTYLYRKANTNQGIYFLKHFQKMFKHFAEYEDKRNIKLDIHVSVFPVFENESKNEHKSDTKSSYNVLQKKPTVIYNVEPQTTISRKLKEDSIKGGKKSESKCDLDFIPLLDGAASKANYTFHENSGDKLKYDTEILNKDSVGNVICDLGITEELNELKSVIKCLASTTEKFIAEHQKHSRHSCTLTSLSQNDSTERGFTSKRQSTAKKASKAIQFSSNFANNQLQSGLKISKEPKKKDPAEFHNRLTKKSTSYNIIESESILKVTDMTSADEENNYKVMDEALTCSLPRSKSLFELVSDKNKWKLLAYFCNERNDDIYNASGQTTSGLKQSSVKSNIEKSLSQMSPSTDKCSNISQPINIDVVCSDKCGINTGDNYSTSVYIDDDDDIKCSDIQNHRGMRFGEGFVYCILLLIPLTIIAFLFYGYVIQDYLLASYSDDTKNKFYLKITDLGF